MNPAQLTEKCLCTLCSIWFHLLTTPLQKCSTAKSLMCSFYLAVGLTPRNKHGCSQIGLTDVFHWFFSAHIAAQTHKHARGKVSDINFKTASLFPKMFQILKMQTYTSHIADIFHISQDRFFPMSIVWNTPESPLKRLWSAQVTMQVACVVRSPAIWDPRWITLKIKSKQTKGI